MNKLSPVTVSNANYSSDMLIMSSPITNRDRVRCVSRDKIYQTLSGFEPATPRFRSKNSTNLLQLYMYGPQE